MKKNIYTPLPGVEQGEAFEELVNKPGVRIERIVSRGHTSPETGWYDQEEHEWVMVLQGAGVITFANGVSCTLEKGDYLNIPARCKHRVSWTDPEQPTLWLAVFYR